VVTYLVASQGPGVFQGEIRVINNTAQPIGNWQIVVALNDDVVTSFTNGVLFHNHKGRARPGRVPADGEHMSDEVLVERHGTARCRSS
jgi:hypothetical protein